MAETTDIGDDEIMEAVKEACLARIKSGAMQCNLDYWMGVRAVLKALGAKQQQMAEFYVLMVATGRDFQDL